MNVSKLQLSTVQRLRLTLMGVTPTEKKQLPGWKHGMQFYAFNCKKHGLVENYPHGYMKKLACPLCTSEKQDTRAST